MSDVDFDSYETIPGGAFNPFVVTTPLSADPLRGTSVQLLNSALREAYGKDCLKNLDEFFGVVIYQLNRDVPTAENKLSWSTTEAGGDQSATPYDVYKVYIPELECRPFPDSYTDPIISTYQDVSASPGLLMSVAEGAIVKVKFSNLPAMLDPIIVAVEGAIEGFVPAVQTNLAGGFAGGEPTLVAGWEQPPPPAAENNYPPVKTKTPTDTDINHFAAAVKNVVPDGNPRLQAAIVAVAKQEQNFRGFNNNYYGVMADVGRGWGAAGKQYIKGSFTSTEGASGQGKRTTKYRYFAAFDSEADGIRFMYQKLEQKGFADGTTPEDFARLYYSKWLSAPYSSTSLARVATNYSSAAAALERRGLL